MGKIVKNADEAARILKELVETPQATRVHFEFDFMAGGGVPRVSYSVDRFAYTMTEDDTENIDRKEMKP